MSTKPLIDVAGIRDELGLKPRELAEQLEISPSHLSMIENGHREVTLKQARKLEELTRRKDIVPVVVERLSA